MDKQECQEVDKHLSLPSLCDYRLAIGYFRVVKDGGESYPRFPSEFGGSRSVPLFWISLREFVFGSVGRPVGKTAASSPRGATQTPGYVKELKLVWFGNFRILFGSDILAYPVRLSSKYYVIHR